jgi:hypothetical protein
MTNPLLLQPQQTYLNRVAQFYSQVKEWLTKDFVITETHTEVRENLGQYLAPVLAIRNLELPTPEEVIAELVPKGTAVFMGEGLIKLVGSFGEEWITYLLIDTVPMVMDRAGREHRMFKGIDQEGWYWTEDSRRNRVHLLDKNLFLELLTLVSDYEF